MINHSRTLLLNVDGSGSGYSGQPGDEFIPPDYRQVVLPSYLSNIHRTLFGKNPDRIFMNYRVRQLLGLLHVTELAEFVAELDPRITYDVLPYDQLFDDYFTGTIQPLTSNPQQLYIQGRIAPTDSVAKLQQQWLVAVISGSVCRVTRQTAPGSTVDVNYILTSGLSSAVPLHGASLSVKFDAGIGSQWFVRSAVRPGTDLATLMANVDSITEDVTLELFGVGSPRGAGEPFKTFRNLFKLHPEMPYRMGGILLAFIYELDRLRQ